MDEKLPYDDCQRPVGWVQPRQRCARLRRNVLRIVGVVALLWCLHQLLFPSPTISCRFPYQEALRGTELKVPLEAHIMSKCPDAKDCLQKLVLPTMANASDKIDFKLSFIGRTTDHDDGVECPHGQTECLGDIIELCAATLYPDPKIYLGFAMCLTRDYSEIPQRSLVEDCALEHGIDFGKLNDCSSKDDGAYGIRLLRESVERSNDLDVHISCTVRLADKVRCVRDGGQWKDCDDGAEPEDLIRDVNSLYENGEH
ncbi:hypothetical protein BDY21DRAFT_282761 [Lineolata rhizophorae]|uniref:Gamma interferon inducible lysosomal thiol reductase-domain-containing protein n=1 Tax=Lineolata rhizophorae TaxID=578093 RepID=A0A6A6P511_9PEZI|nr:hypothetical protein BDY21DRAFT_282761 [Lineolata rhizophorae]